jgi:ribonuclease HI
VKDESQIPNPQSRSGSGIVAFIDGGARGNPGPAGYGVRIEDELGAIITEFNGFLGASTNNVAEYNGLVAALKYAQQHGHRVVRIKSDSELLVKQMRGEYRDCRRARTRRLRARPARAEQRRGPAGQSGNGPGDENHVVTRD